MRFKSLIALSLVIPALLAINGCAIRDGGSGLSADQLIDASRGIYKPYTGITETPQEARKLWSQEGGINFTVPGKLSGNGSNPQSAQPAVSAALPAITQTASPALGVAGNWSFRLRDSKNRFLALTLFQSDNAIFGTGNMNDGGDTMKASASGSVFADRMSLDVISSGTVNLYRLRLNLSGSSASGEYVAFSTKGDPWTGIVEGMLAAK